MGLTRNTDQKSKTLTEFYKELSEEDNVVWKGVGTLMMNWIDHINSELGSTEIWGLTSHEHLILQTKNDYTSRTYVVIYASMDEYHIEYLIPENKAPWEHAWVKGATKSIDKAMNMLKIAMVNSGGWEISAELTIKNNLQHDV